MARLKWTNSDEWEYLHSAYDDLQQQEQEYQEDVEEFPLFHWKEICIEKPMSGKIHNLPF